MYTIMKTEKKNEYVLIDNALDMAIAAGTHREMRMLMMSLKVKYEVNLYIAA